MRLRLIRVGYKLAWLGLWLTSPLRRGRGRGAKAILCHEGRILLVQHTYGPRRWELPGGGLRRDEAPLAGVRREIREELAVELGDVRLIAYGSGSPRHNARVISIFAAELPTAAVTPDVREIARAQWHDPDALPSALGWQVAAAVNALRTVSAADDPVRLAA